MPEQQESRRVFSLLEVTQSIQRTLAERYTSSFWVKAEMNKLNHYPHSGHCYPDLVEKNNGRVIAQLRSVLWKDDFERVNTNFIRVLKTPLKDGIKMLFCAKITFDPAHGLSLRIIDIDPIFSLGELEREKLETVDSLKRDQLFHLNRSLPFPLIPQRIAIISVETSKGYADFLKVVEGNTEGFRFFHLLFPSLLQGEKAVESILFQLEQIRRVRDHFDVVAIIRGGGGEVGLASFNNYELAKAICTFPIPVITGIGHATNETVTEMVAYKNAITPTDLGNFLIERFRQFSVPVMNAEEKIHGLAIRMLRQRREEIGHAARYFKSITTRALGQHHHELAGSGVRMMQNCRYRFKEERATQRELVVRIRESTEALARDHFTGVQELCNVLTRSTKASIQWHVQYTQELERVVKNLDPRNVLRRGFTITRVSGTIVRSVEQLSAEDTIQTELADGRLTSTIKEIKKQDNE